MLVVAIAFVGALLFMRIEAEKVQSEQKNVPTPVQTSQNTSETGERVAGRYADYDEASISEKGYNDTVLFFYASWCPECRAFDQVIQESNLPDGVQILKVNYDTATNLRQKYGVTLQSSFVSVKPNGDKIIYWQGYGKDKSVDAILENT